MRGAISRIPIKGRCLFDEPLSRHTTFRIGGPAKALCQPQDLDDLRTLLTFAMDNSLAISVIGNGSNLLVSDRGIEGIVLKLSSPYFSRIYHCQDSSTVIEAWAGVSIASLLRFLQAKGLAGLEQLAGIPGTLAGAISMNAQGIGEYVESVCGISQDGAMHIINKDNLIFGYRSFKTDIKNLIILMARLRLKRMTPEAVRDRIREILSCRKNTQELKLPSAGCVFKNPQAATAGELLEKAGLKGRRIGDASVSYKHANFIVNLGCATSADVVQLIELAQLTIQKRFQVLLEPEIRFVGF